MGLDVTAPVDGMHQPLPVIVFLHGFKGFKDWGHFPAIAEEAARQGFIFLKYNLSHNGVTPEHPQDFVDLEAFGHNTYSRELADTQTVFDWLCNNQADLTGARFTDTGLVPDWQQLAFLAHSRGGAISILHTARDPRIKLLITWAAVADLYARYPVNLRQIVRTKGVFHIPNARTGQQMPVYADIIDDMEANPQAFDVQGAMSRLQVPHLIVHGEADETVHMFDAQRLADANPRVAKVFLVPGGDHTFGGTHPFTSNLLPEHTAKALERTLYFVRTKA